MCVTAAADDAPQVTLGAAGVPAAQLAAARAHAKRFARADDAAAWRALAATAAAQAAAFALHARSRPAAVCLQAAVSVRAFIIFHDTVHGSFFASPAANRVLGRALSAWTLTPYMEWRAMHLFHHAHSGNLSEFDAADTVAFTAAQYGALPRWARWAVRCAREPLVFHLLVPLLQWWLLYPLGGGADRYVLAGHVAHGALARYCFGWAHLLGLYCACVAGVALFHLQHAGATCYRAHGPAYSPDVASLRGATHLRVPWPLAWATLGIEFHHLHHLDTRVPCYALADCHVSAPPDAWAGVVTLGAREAAAAMRNVMYDEAARRVVPFGA